MSGLEDLYREIILDHYRNPRNRGELEVPPAYRAEGFNPLCGDEIVVYLDLGPDGTVSEVRIGGTGCSISQSSASMMSAAIKGMTVDEVRNGRYYELIKRFEEKTGSPVIINTSFNVRGEPIVCTPNDAYRCFMGTHMDVLVIENYVLLKPDQPKENAENYLEEFALD